MRLFAVALMALSPGAAGAVPASSPPLVKRALPPPAPADCPRIASHHAFEPAQRLKPRKLGELPPANAYAAVLRHDGTCEVPVIIKYGVGRR